MKTNKKARQARQQAIKEAFKRTTEEVLAEKNQGQPLHDTEGWQYPSRSKAIVAELLDFGVSPFDAANLVCLGGTEGMYRNAHGRILCGTEVLILAQKMGSFDCELPIAEKIAARGKQLKSTNEALYYEVIARLDQLDV